MDIKDPSIIQAVAHANNLLSPHTADISQVQKSLFVNDDTIEDIEDEDDVYATIPGQTLSSMPVDNVTQASKDYIDAAQAISNNPWDYQSWLVYVEEVEQGRGGATSLEDVYMKFLDRFPLAFKIWRQLALYYKNKQEYKLAEATYMKCLDKCRHVSLWLDYLIMLKQTTIEKISKQDEKQYVYYRQHIENMIEKAVSSVGMFVDASPLWRLYIDFIKEYPELGVADPGRKLQQLRKVYQRAICIPMLDIETVWKEYETLEKTAGEHLADRVLPEFKEKNLHAKAIFKERERLTAIIAFDRLAIPPSQQSSVILEAQQLDMWNKWIRYELGNPDNLSKDAHHSMLQYIYRRCLCCFRYHAEIWLSFAYWEQSHGYITESRNILSEGIEVLPDVAVLRIALAELEERQALVDPSSLSNGLSNGSSSGYHNFQISKSILKEAFDKLCTPYTFSVYQRFIRRTEGISAARKLFSDTYKLRQEHKLGHEIFMVHAQLELDVNTAPTTAAQILKLAMLTCPDAIKDDMFIRLYIRILLRLGDLKQIQYICAIALGKEANTSLEDMVPGPPNSNRIINSNGNGSHDSISNTIYSNLETTAKNEETLVFPSIQNPVHKYYIWNDLLYAEMTLNQSNIRRLDELRKKRDDARLYMEDINRGRLDVHTGKWRDIRDKQQQQHSTSTTTPILNLFDMAKDLYERYPIMTNNDQLEDIHIKNRIFKRINTDMSSSGGPSMLPSDNTMAMGSRKLGNNMVTSTNIDMSNIATDNSLFREFLAKLPPYTGQSQDIDSFIRQLKILILPPRPGTEESAVTENTWNKKARLGGGGGSNVSGMSTGMGGGGGGGGIQEDSMNIDSKPVAITDDIYYDVGYDLNTRGGSSNGGNNGTSTGSREDVFRQRRRGGLSTNKR